jgi:hypothetical protein
MAIDTSSSEVKNPPRDDVRPESYGIRVTDEAVYIWQYRVTLAEPDGEWHHVETLDQTDQPRLSLEYVTVAPPDEDGYWIYSKSCDCALDCN